ncbi:hypothetical protein SNA94_01615, partial [Escherichia coli]|nr:hypothetical protein [Escherichia coli]
CHGTVCVVGKMRDLILQLSKSSIYSTKPPGGFIPSRSENRPIKLILQFRWDAERDQIRFAHCKDHISE